MTMSQASVRRTDRVVVQVGTSLGERDDCDIVGLSQASEDAIRDAWSQPHGNIYLAANGTVTFDPPPPAPAPTAEQLAFEADRQTLRDFAVDANVDAFLAAVNGDPAITAAQRDFVIKRTVRDLRAFGRVVRFLVRKDLV